MAENDVGPGLAEDAAQPVKARVRPPCSSAAAVRAGGHGPAHGTSAQTEHDFGHGTGLLSAEA